MNLTKSIDILSLITVFLVVIAILILSAGPVGDGDLWWQMAYGRYLLENGTLIPDHSAFSWTVAENSIIYCAWVSEIILYVTYEFFGIIGVSVFRYLAMLMPLFLVMWLLYRDNRTMFAPIWLYVFLCYSISRHAGGLLKPELFSYAFFTCLVALYFAIKSTETKAVKLIYVIPVLLFLWVNTHAGFIMGCIFLAIAVSGELLNRVLDAKAKLTMVQWRYIWYVVPLTIIAICLTPYGIEYPIQLIQQNLLNQHDLAYQSVAAYNSIYSEKMSNLGATKYLVICLVLLLPLFIETAIRREMDYALITLNIVFLIISASWGRFSYFSPIVMLFTFVHLSRSSRIFNMLVGSPKRLNVISLFCAFFVLVMTTQTVIANKTGDARGGAFDVGYLNAQSETRFVEKYFSDRKLCNGYDGGGYLLWKLWPNQKVMIDPRYFPFYSWYGDWVSMKNAPNPQRQIKTFDCDLWVLNHSYGSLNSALIKMPEWKLIFMGASSAVYVKSHSLHPSGGIELAEEASSVLSLPRTALIINSLLQAKEYDLALQVAGQARGYWANTANRGKSENAYDFVQGTIAYQSKENFNAYHLLKQANQGSPVITNVARLVKAGQFLTEQLWYQGNVRTAHNVALDTYELAPENIINLYNVGMLGFESSASGLGNGRDKWQKPLSQFVERSEHDSTVPKHYIHFARKMLEDGISSKNPPLLPSDDRLGVK